MYVPHIVEDGSLDRLAVANCFGLRQIDPEWGEGAVNIAHIFEEASRFHNVCRCAFMRDKRTTVGLLLTEAEGGDTKKAINDIRDHS